MAKGCVEGQAAGPVQGSLEIHRVQLNAEIADTNGFCRVWKWLKGLIIYIVSSESFLCVVSQFIRENVGKGDPEHDSALQGIDASPRPESCKPNEP